MREVSDCIKGISKLRADEETCKSTKSNMRVLTALRQPQMSNEARGRSDEIPVVRLLVEPFIGGDLLSEDSNDVVTVGVAVLLDRDDR